MNLQEGYFVAKYAVTLPEFRILKGLRSIFRGGSRRAAQGAMTAEARHATRTKKVVEEVFGEAASSTPKPSVDPFKEHGANKIFGGAKNTIKGSRPKAPKGGSQTGAAQPPPPPPQGGQAGAPPSPEGGRVPAPKEPKEPKPPKSGEAGPDDTTSWSQWIRHPTNAALLGVTGGFLLSNMMRR